MATPENQIAYPTSTVSNAWTLVPGGGESAYEDIDDYGSLGTTASDGDTTQINDAGSPFPLRECVIGLSAVSDPSLSWGHMVYYESRKTGTGTFASPAYAQLEDSIGTVLATFDIDENPAWGSTSSFTLSSTQVAAIVSASAYGTLRVRFVAPPVPSGGTAKIRVTAIRLEVPKARLGRARSGARGRVISGAPTSGYCRARSGVRARVTIVDSASSAKYVRGRGGARGRAMALSGDRSYGFARSGARGVCEVYSVVGALDNPPAATAYSPAQEVSFTGIVASEIPMGGIERFEATQ